jgi:hypothetical protein
MPILPFRNFKWATHTIGPLIDKFFDMHVTIKKAVFTIACCLLGLLAITRQKDKSGGTNNNEINAVKSANAMKTCTDTSFKSHVIYKNGDNFVVESHLKNCEGVRKVFVNVKTTEIKCRLEIAEEIWLGVKPDRISNIGESNLKSLFLNTGRFMPTDFVVEKESLKGIGVDCNRLTWIRMGLDEYADREDNESPFIHRKFSIIINGTIGQSGAYVFVDTPYFSNRLQNKKASWGYTYAIAAGYRSSRGHLFYLEFGTQKMGFTSRYTEIDWQTGLVQSMASDRLIKYDFESSTLGVGYYYSPISKKNTITLLMHAGLNYTFNTSLRFSPNELNSKDENYIIKNRLGVRAGIGLSVKGGSRFSVNVMPLYHVDLTPVNNGTIKTRLNLLGLNLGLAFHLF